MGKLAWAKIGKSAADNFSEEATIHRARTVFPARGVTLSTYQIEELNGTQRLSLPNTAPGIVETGDDGDDDDDDDDDDGDQNNNAAASDAYGA